MTTRLEHMSFRNRLIPGSMLLNISKTMNVEFRPGVVISTNRHPCPMLSISQLAERTQSAIAKPPPKSKSLYHFLPMLRMSTMRLLLHEPQQRPRMTPSTKGRSMTLLRRWKICVSCSIPTVTRPSLLHHPTTKDVT